MAGDESVNKTDQNPPGSYIVIARGTMQSAGDGKRKARDPTSSLKKDPCGCLTENRLKTDAGRSGETSEEAPAITQVRDDGGLDSASALRAAPTDPQGASIQGVRERSRMTQGLWV